MTTAEDIDAIRSAYSAWNRGDVNGLLEGMADEVEVVPVLGDVVSADRFRGHEGVRRWYETVHSTLENFRAEIKDVIEIGDGRYLVKLHFSGHGKASGAPVALDAAHILTVEAAKAVRLEGSRSRRGDHRVSMSRFHRPNQGLHGKASTEHVVQLPADACFA